MVGARPETVNGLHWLRGELDACLQRARSAIEGYLDGRDDRGPLLDAIEELRQVRGTLAMIQCSGGSALAQEMLALAQAAADGRLDAGEEAFAALSGATLQLSDYLELLALGERDHALVLQPLINELRLARGAALRTEADLFATQWLAADPPLQPPQVGVSSSAQTVARRQLPVFQNAFLRWLRGTATAASLGEMAAVAEAVAQACGDPARRRRWWMLALLSESLAAAPGALADSLELKRLFGRAGVALKQLAESGEAVEDDGVDAFHAVYYLLRLPQPSARAAAALEPLGGAELLPDAEELERLRRRMRGPNSGILQRVYDEIRDEFQAVKDGIDLIVRTRGRAGADVEGIRQRLQQLSRLLALLGLPGPQQALANHARALADRPADTAAWMDLATALLRVELSLEEALFRAQGRYAAGPPRSYDEIEAEIPPARDLRDSVLALLRECLVNVAQLRTAVDASLKGGDVLALRDVPSWLREVAAALDVLDRRRAARLVQALEAYARSGALDRLPARPEEANRFADAVSALELFLESLRDGLPSLEVLVDDLAGYVERLQSVEAEPAPASLEPPPLPAVAPPPAPGVDTEIVEVFIEEANDLVADLRRLQAALARSSEDRERLAELRRAFHTLKGSGRMVGAVHIGELAWAVERVLNRCLEGRLVVAAPVLELTAAAAAVLPALIAGLREGVPAPAEVGELIAHATRLAEAESAAPDMTAIFRGDARERLGLVARWLETQDAEAGAEVEPEVIRAFHTLRGSAAAVQAQAVSQVAAAFENYLNELRANRRRLSAESLALLAEGVTALGGWVARAGAGEPEAASVQGLLQRITALGGGLPAAQATEDRQAESLRLLEALQAVETAVGEWTASAAPAPPEQVLARLAELEPRAQALECAALAEVAAALHSQLAQAEAPSPALCAALADILEGAYQLLDAFHDHAEADAAPLLDRIAGLPVTAPAPIAAPSAAGESLEAEPAMAASPGVREPEEDTELRAIFDAEAEELFAELDARFADWSAQPDSVQAPAQIQRALHTLKGSARMAGQAALGAEAARLEQALDGELSSGRATPTAIAAFGAELRGLRQRLASSAVAQAGATPVAPVFPPAGAESSAIQESIEEPTEEVIEDLIDEPVEAHVETPPGTQTPEVSPESAGAEAAPSTEFDSELVGVFAVEAAELVEQMEDALDAWQGGDDGEPVRTLQRALHTIKGGARVAGLESIADSAHAMETRVEQVVARGEFPDVEIFAQLRESLDRLAALRDRLARGEWRPTAPEVAEAAESPWADTLRWQPPETAAGAGAPTRETARVAVEALDAMLAQAGEISIFRSRLEEHAAGLRAQLEEVAGTITRVRHQLRLLDIETEAQIAARGLSAAGPDRYATDFDPLEMDRYTRMQELSRALAESSNDLAALQTSMEVELAETEALLGQQARVTGQVQQGLMSALMVPFSRQMARLSRLVRSSAAELGKSAELVVEGAGTELDRNVLERITPPLEHLLRNAVVHGIEAPSVRRAAGKPEVGRILLRASREGGQLSLELADDGAGLDFAAIRARAVERGLLRADARASQDDLARFIFEPGFSTARALTQDAGRGIGLDVVASAVKQLGGSLELRSQPGEGTRFIIRLPLSLALARALLVEIGGEVYAIPLPQVEGVARLPAAELQQRLGSDGEPLRYGGHEYPLHYLGDFVGLPRPTEVESRTVTAILLRAGETLTGSARRTALAVDQLLGSREIVSKPAGPQLSSIPGIAGGTILADGSVVLMLDVPALLSEAARRALAGEAEAAVAAPARDTVMVVDDSVTMRRVAERLLSRRGFRVVTARDGLEAMALLGSETPAVVLLDIEMPRADGFEVAAFMRNNERLARTPIIMITSRSGEKHRARARNLGVQRYLIKPYQEEQLLGEVEAVRAEVAHA